MRAHTPRPSSPLSRPGSIESPLCIRAQRLAALLMAHPTSPPDSLRGLRIFASAATNAATQRAGPSLSLVSVRNSHRKPRTLDPICACAVHSQAACSADVNGHGLHLACTLRGHVRGEGKHGAALAAIHMHGLRIHPLISSGMAPHSIPLPAVGLMAGVCLLQCIRTEPAPPTPGSCMLGASAKNFKPS